VQAGGGGHLYTVGGAYASTAGQVWYAWVQEPSWEDIENHEVVVRASN
jgi:hypothetical protein